MKKKINMRLLGITVAAVLAAVIGITIVYYGLFQKQVRSDLAVSAKLLRDTNYFELRKQRSLILLFGVPFAYYVPVYDLPKGFQVCRTAVLVVKIIGVLPYVEGQEGLEASAQGIACILLLDDAELA